MTDTTTIEITVEQRDALKARKKVPRESYQSVMDRLLADDDPADETDADDADDTADLEPLTKQVFELYERLGSIEQTLEEMQHGRY
jgi:RNA polymerase-binding transcription factor DksA